MTKTVVQPATPSETADLFEGIPDYYSWWKRFHPGTIPADGNEDNATSWELDSDLNAPDDWVYTVIAENPEARGRISREVRHADIVAACRKILSEPNGQATAYSRRMCRAANIILHDSDDMGEIDSDDADVIIQVAVFGEAHYS